MKSSHCSLSDLAYRLATQASLSFRPSPGLSLSYSNLLPAGSGSAEAPLHEFVLSFPDPPPTGLQRLCASEDSHAVSCCPRGQVRPLLSKPALARYPERGTGPSRVAQANEPSESQYQVLSTEHSPTATERVEEVEDAITPPMPPPPGVYNQSRREGGDQWFLALQCFRVTAPAPGPDADGIGLGRTQASELIERYQVFLMWSQASEPLDPNKCNQKSGIFTPKKVHNAVALLPPEGAKLQRCGEASGQHLG